MLAECLQVIRSSVSGSHVQIDCSGTLLALPLARCTVGIWSLQHIGHKPLELVGHRKAIAALTFSHDNFPQRLCSAADDYIIIWNIDESRTAHEQGHQIKGRVISQSLGLVEYMSFSNDDKLIAVCADKFIYIIHSKEEKLETTLEGHNARVTSAMFCPHYTSTLVSISDDRTFKIWDLMEGNLVYQSCIISASPFISLAMHPQVEQFMVGTTDGQVRVFDLSDGKGFHCLHQIDIDKIIRKKQENKDASLVENNGPKTISCRKSWQRSDLGNDEMLTSPPDEKADIGCSIIGLHYTRNYESCKQPSEQKLSFLKTNDSLVNELLDSQPSLYIVSTGALVKLNAKTLDLLGYLDFQDPIMCVDDVDEGCETVCAAGNVVFASEFNKQKCQCVVGSLFQNVFYILSVETTSEDDGRISETRIVKSASRDGEDISSKLTEITVLSNFALRKDSPLRAELCPKMKQDQPPVKQRTTSSTTRPSLPGSLDKRGKISEDKPLIFNSKIRSSGYATETKKTMFQPQINSSKKTKPQKSKTIRSQSVDGPVVREYPTDGVAPTVLQMKIDADVKSVGINAVRFSDDGRYLACALANKSAISFKLPLRETSKDVAYSGHKESVGSVRWSRDSNLLLTVSDDSTAAIWCKNQVDPVLVINSELSNFDADKSNKENCPFVKGIKHAQFYYMDKFVLLTSGQHFYLYKYHLDPVKSDLKRYKSRSRYKLVRKIQMSNTHAITASSSINSFYSYIILCAGTNKSIEVFDMNVCKSVLNLADVHTKPVHHISQNEGSGFVSHASNAYDLFLTAAAGDCVKMWDLRTRRCVRRYEGHKNRVYPCGVTISPCSRFIATGAEDKCAYIYDIRAGDYLHKLSGHNDIISDVHFHPLYPQLATTTLDGKIRMFSQ